MVEEEKVMEEIKVIFLDIDGVLNFKGHLEDVRGDFCLTDEQFDKSELINRQKLNLLSTFVKMTGAKVVLSSSWRVGWQNEKEIPVADEIYKKTDELFEKNGIRIYDTTTSKIRDWNENARGNQISDWLEHHPETTEYVIFDDTVRDIENVGNLSLHLVQTDPDYGLCAENISAASKILRNSCFIYSLFSDDEFDIPMAVNF